MKPRFATWNEETLDLAVERVTVGLDAERDARLEASADAEGLEELEHAAAAILLAHLDRLERPPAAFLDRLEATGRDAVARAARPAPRALTRATPAPRSTAPASGGALAWTGWLAAAALLAWLLLGDSRPDAATRRRRLLGRADDLVLVDWVATADPAAEGASGDVAWSSSAQEGYMRFRGLAPNDPKEQQYQLWIFDPSRSDWEAEPVDGGVFDVGAGGEVVVPIDAKLAVAETALFAVTLEVPGGVVVSDRERLVLTASP